MNLPAPPDRPEAPPLRGGVAVTAGAVAAWSVLVAVAWVRGEPYRALWKLRAAPLAGFFDRHVSWGTVLALAVGLAAARLLPGWCARARWRHLLVAGAVGAAMWGGVLGLTRGVDEMDRGMANANEYVAIIPVVDDLGIGPFVDTFTDPEVLRGYPIHIQGHPLAAALGFVGLDRLGLVGPGWASLVVVALGSTVVSAVLVTVRQVAGEDRARRAAPFLMLAPALVWGVVSADLVFAAVGAWGVALATLACAPGATARQRAAFGLGSGLMWGLGVNLSYGLVPLGLVAAVIVVSRRRWDVLAWVAAGALAVVGSFAAVGFWWFDGLEATRVRYEEGIAQVRPRRFFTFIGNPAAFSVALGPALWVAVVRVRDRGLWLLAGAALAAVVVANASGLSKSEVERIWLPFWPWLVALCGGLAAPALRAAGTDRRRVRSFAPDWPAVAANLLVLQVLVAVAVETVVKTPW